MQDVINRFLESLNGQLDVIRETCRPFVSDDSIVDPASGAMLISHRPKVAPQAYACVLFPGIPDNLISQYEEVHSKVTKGPFAIPNSYHDALTRLNGASLFQIDLFGLPSSMTNNPPILSRSVRQPLDLATANRHWLAAFKPKQSQFHIGSGPFSWEENLGYFLNEDGSVDALRKGGDTFNTWPNFGSFLAVELSRATSLYPSYEEKCFEFRQQLEAKELERKLAKRTRKK